MSFKRDGDDYHGLGVLKLRTPLFTKLDIKAKIWQRIRVVHDLCAWKLQFEQKRRVAELFASDIPDGEALLCSNGRFACTVCKHKPVFDTVNMLAVHRKGKKHLANAAMATAQQEELQDLILKRQQEMYLDSNNSDLGIRNIRSGGILTAPAYDPRVRRHKVKPHERKPRLDLSGEASSHNNDMKESKSDSYDSTLNRPFKNFKKEFLRQQKGDDAGGSGPVTGVVSSSNDQKFQQNNSQSSTNQISQSTTVSVAQMPENTTPKETVPSEPVYVHQKYFKKKHYIYHQSNRTDLSQEEREKKEKYLQLRGAGWKKDWCGKWIKEEGVEFDSDEEVPDVP